MSTPSRRPLYRRDDVDQAAKPAPIGSRRLPIEAAVLSGQAAIVDVHQEQAEQPGRRPLGRGFLPAEPAAGGGAS
ncbi:hypothetical protein ACIOJE_40715 [Kitasatospora sp. NPDC087861]|uniref:hypothetical protein n=1 Tax=Kitasatospora sp. NPDC087861 TaxID=3364070 RepID=UPI003810601F